VGDLAQPFAAVRYLADDALRGRLAGTPEAECAARYIAEEFRRVGLVPAGDDSTYFQAVPLASAANPHAPAGTGHNVVGILPGADPDRSREAVVVGAHYDHLGLGGFGSVHPDEAGRIHNGADDNASGVGALLAIAEALARGPRPPRSVVFVAFTGEEMGLVGSAQYVRSPAVPLDRTVAMLNLDMVGRLGSNPLLVYGVGTAREWESLLRSAADAVGLALALRPEGFGPSDHTSFYARDVPVLHVFTNVHGDYHRPSDDWDKIDVDGLRRVAAFVARVARAVADRPERLTLVRGAGRPPAPPDRDAGYGAYLGTVPDFAPVERGVRLNGVSPGSPAERAGLRAGDVIVGLGDREIEDLRALAEALRAHAPGTAVEVRFLRDGRAQSVTVVLGRRGSGPK
jgi:hypothetical protein